MPLAARWVALRVALQVGQWVAPVPVRWPVAWARVAKWQVGWALRGAQWVAPVPVRWQVAWARPVDKWAAWA